jgi:uncharacterized membrane protein (UPF0127 family)
VKQRIVLGALTLTCVTAPFGCRDAPTATPTTAPAAEVVRMQIGSETFTLEVADSEDEQEKGLMARESMPADHGMIFVFPDSRKLGFWMKNTLIPLDIIYIDETGRVVSVKSMQPHDLTAVRSDGPAMYAIELNQGAAARVGVRGGDVLTIPSSIRERQLRK